MKRALQLCLVSVVFAIIATFAKPAVADYPYGCGGYGDGYFNAFYRRGYIDKQPPYFSQFPPVYYSNVIIPRPYGWSPFALRPTDFDRIPLGGTPEPKTILNPHVEEQRGKVLQRDNRAKTASAARRAPLMIHNPYVVSESTASQLVQNSDDK
jgi:hypothetical protein